jgi:hypothetical protein
MASLHLDFPTQFLEGTPVHNNPSVLKWLTGHWRQDQSKKEQRQLFLFQPAHQTLR